LSRTHYDVEIEHFLMKLLDASDGDFAYILKQYEVNRSRLATDLTRSLDKLKSGNARTPALSPSLTKMLSGAWLIGSVDYGASAIRTGYTILALASDDELRRLMQDVSREFAKIPGESLSKDFSAIVERSVEEATAAGGTPPAPGDAPRAASGKTPNLDHFTINLTERARQGALDPVLGRDFEVRQVVDILTRRRQNNPILVGEAGVGKTAVVEGFAMRIVQGDVPPVLKNVSLRTLDLALLQAGAGIKGEFENRLKGLIEEVRSSPTPIILFIDEAHTMIGAGGAAGQSDAANLLKPARAPGELRTIAATTWSEYKKYFEKDPALARRFQLVKVEEPSEQVCLVMMRGVVPSLEKHHKVRILDDGAEAAVRLSHRYLADRQLPDKAVSVLDTACARLALGQHALPAALEDAMRTLDDLAVQTRVLKRERAVGADHAERLRQLADQTAETEGRLTSLKARWERERDLVAKVRDVRERLEASAGEAPGSDGGGKAGDALRAELAGLTSELRALQGETPLVQVVVDSNLIGQVISGWTGIPIGKMLRDEAHVTLDLERLLGARIIGQGHALEAISRRIRTSRAGIEDPGKPVGVLLLVGPSGVVKDGAGRQIDFKNTILVLTTNAGTDTLMKLCADPETMPEADGLVKALKPELNKIFKPAFLGRTVIIPYFPVRDEALKRIIRLKLGKVERRLEESHNVRLKYADALVDAVAQRCTEVESGARNVDNILTNTLLPEISRLLLESLAEGARPEAIRVGVGEGGAFTYAGESAGAGVPAAAAAGS